MNAELLFDFTVDKANNSIQITREFNADLALVWEAFTVPEILDQWGAPAPWIARTSRMNFREGGSRLYAMQGPGGEEHWSVQEFTTIRPTTYFQMMTNFADKEGRITSGFPSSENNLHFSEENGVTTVRMSIRYASAEVLEMMVSRGFKEGMGASLANLELVLTRLNSKHA